jgi:hypothetical protein
LNEYLALLFIGVIEILPPLRDFANWLTRSGAQQQKIKTGTKTWMG